MDLFLLLYLFFLAVFLTFGFTLIFRNRGPWNNPMLFFLVLFLTSWVIILWLGPVSIRGESHPYLSATLFSVLVALLLAATRITKLEKEKVRRLEDKEVVEVVTKAEYRQNRVIPNVFFWVLITLESLMIIAAYSFKFNPTVV